jgi:RNA polymerase sigma factor (sigma-70 family)
MGRGQIGGVLHYLRGLFRAPAATQTDRELLHAFAGRRDETAFAALVERHGPLVWGVCRRLLRDEQDAEDAFQATFLVLAKKADSIPWREDAGNWLYAVALRVARKARARAARRRQVEGEVIMSARTAVEGAPDDEVGGIVAEEVGRLPEKYRRPVVLCCLQGKSYGEAARLLGWPEGTVSGRLARARELLRRRLVRRGLALPAGGVAALLAAEAAGGAMPAAVAQATLRAALTFAAGQGLTSVPAALAEEVLRAMFLSKLKAGAALLLALAVVGTGLGVWARGGGEPAPPAPEQPPAERPKEEAATKPALPAAWAGRWVADPFAGAESIEVLHASKGNGGSLTYKIKDPKAVAALLKTVHITGVHNDIFVGSVPTAHVTVRRKDGTTFEAGVEGATTLSSSYGLLYLKEDFITALGRQLGDESDEPIDLLKFRPAPPAPKPEPRVAPSERSLTAGFKSLTVQYPVGRRLHEARFTDEKTLDALHKALTIVKKGEAPKEKGLPRNSRSLTIVSKDKSVFYGHTLGADEFFDYDAGSFAVLPAFMKALTKEVSRVEGRDIDITGENALTEAQVKRGGELRELLAGLRSVRCELLYSNPAIRHTGPDRPGPETLVVNKPEEVKEFVSLLTWLEVPVKEYKLAKGDRFFKLETKDGKTVEVTSLKAGEDNALVDAFPTAGELVEVAGFGQVWVDNGWKSHLLVIEYKRKLEEKERRDRETARLVGRDLPTFYKQVLTVVVHYREGESELTNHLEPDASRAVLDALAAGKLEKLDWTEERWQKELRDLYDRGAGELALAPGLGFSLPVVIAGEKEVLIPMCGRVTFAASPVAKFQKAINADKPEAVELLPRAKGKEEEKE